MKVKYWAYSLAGTSIYATMLAGQLSDRHFVTLHQPAVSIALVVGAVLLAVRISGLEYARGDKEVGALQFVVEIGILILCALAVVLNGALAIFVYGDTPAHNELVVFWDTCFDIIVEAAMTATIWRCSRRSPA